MDLRSFELGKIFQCVKHPVICVTFINGSSLPLPALAETIFYFNLLVLLDQILS